MKKYFISYNGKQYTARQLNLQGTEYKDCIFDGVEISTEELDTATDEGFKKAAHDFESDEYCNAEDALQRNPLFVPASFLESDPTDEEIAAYLFAHNYER